MPAGRPPSRRPLPPLRGDSAARMPAVERQRTPPPPSPSHMPRIGAPPPATGLSMPAGAPLERDWRTSPHELPALDGDALPSFELSGGSEPPARLPSEPAPPVQRDLGGFDLELGLASRPAPPPSEPPPVGRPLTTEAFALDEPAPGARKTAPSDPDDMDAPLAIGLDAPPPVSPPPAAYPGGDAHGAPDQLFSPAPAPPAEPKGPSQATLAAQAMLKSLPSGDEVKRFARNVAVASIGGKQKRVIKLEDPSTWLRPMAGPLAAFGLALLVAVVSVMLTRDSDSDVNLSWVYVPLLIGSILFGVSRWIRLQD
jgi:hypothetical protein